MKISNILLILIFIFFFSLSCSDAQGPAEKAKVIEGDDELYTLLMLNHEAACVEFKKNNGALNLSLGFGSLVRFVDLDLLNRRRNEMGSINFLYYISSDEGINVFAGAGYFIRGSFFGKTDEKYNALTPDTSVYFVAGQKINFSESFFGEMSIRVNDKLSPTIFFGYQF